MANLNERVERLEQAIDGEPEDEIIVIRCIARSQDLHELPQNPADWLTYPPLLAQAPPFGPRVIYLDSDDERKARAAAAMQN